MREASTQQRCTCQCDCLSSLETAWNSPRTSASVLLFAKGVLLGQTRAQLLACCSLILWLCKTEIEPGDHCQYMRVTIAEIYVSRAWKGYTR